MPAQWGWGGEEEGGMGAGYTHTFIIHVNQGCVSLHYLAGMYIYSRKH